MRVLNPNKTVNNIQVLRALAAFLVVVVHLDQLIKSVGITLCTWGGVDIFFVISGFIMVYTTMYKKVSPFQFFTKRITRVAPLYWALTLLVFFIACFAPYILQSTSSNLKDLLKSLFFIPFTKNNGLVEPDLFVGWTINYEMFFYLLFAIGLFVPVYKKGVFLTALILLLLVIIGWVSNTTNIIIKFYTEPIIIEFCFGMFIAFYTQNAHQFIRNSNKTILISIMILSFIVLIIAPGLLFPLPHLIIYGIPASLIVLGAVLLEKNGLNIKNSFLILLGDASYSIYLTHPFVTQIFQFIGHKYHSGGIVSLFLIVLALVSVSGVGILTHYYLERPLSYGFRKRLAATTR
jgi:peptidoglycan/LPS O-acetylase OafA/YrhL